MVLLNLLHQLYYHFILQKIITTETLVSFFKALKKRWELSGCENKSSKRFKAIRE